MMSTIVRMRNPPSCLSRIRGPNRIGSGNASLRVYLSMPAGCLVRNAADVAKHFAFGDDDNMIDMPSLPVFHELANESMLLWTGLIM